MENCCDKFQLIEIMRTEVREIAMENLCYQTLEQQGYDGYLLKDAPERVLQFGEGGFLRAFAEDFIDRMNELAGFDGKVVLVQPRGGHPETCKLFQDQQGLYTLILRGIENGTPVSRTRVISCVSRCLDPKADWQSVLDCASNPQLRFILSNTTEAGIVFDPKCAAEDSPPASFPGKLTILLHERWKLGLNGFIILACELSERNGEALKHCVNQYIDLWGMEHGFREWVARENLFCSTVVDRIVTGYPRAEADAIFQNLGYQDALLDTGEIFASWVIEGPQAIQDEMPFEKARLPVSIVADHVPYKQRKVRILNGAHTGFVPGACLAGMDIVRDCIQNDVILTYMNKMLYEEIIPTLSLGRDDLERFASAVKDRFNNPYINHELTSITLNSTAKWRTRNLPSLLGYFEEYHKLPTCLTMSFAACIAFFSNDVQKLTDCGLVCRHPNGDEYTCVDDRWVLEYYYEHRTDGLEDLIRSIMHSEDMWGMDLTSVPGLEDKVIDGLKLIREQGVLAAYAACL